MFYVLMELLPGRTVKSILYRPDMPNIKSWDWLVKYEQNRKNFVEPTQDEKDDIAEAFKLAYTYVPPRRDRRSVLT